MVRDWLKDAMRAVPTPTRVSAGRFFIAFLMESGMPLFTSRSGLWLAPFWFVLLWLALPWLAGALPPVSGAALPLEAHPAIMATANTQRNKLSFFIIQLLIKIYVFIRKQFLKTKRSCPPSVRKIIRMRRPSGWYMPF
jgi:hypothetical protein